MNRSAARRLWIRRAGRASLMTGVLLFGLIGVQSVLAVGDTTHTALVTDGSPANFGDTVRFTATVTDTDNPGLTPTGMVEFFDGTTSLGTATLDGTGVTHVDVSSLSAGSHDITADYLGDDPFAVSTSNDVTQDVVNAPTTTALSSDDISSVFGETVTLSVHVSSAGGTPAGTVDFLDTTTSTPLGSPTLDGSGNASVMVSDLSVTTHTITATYSGDTFFVTSSDNLDQVVNKSDTTTLVTNDLSGHTAAGTAYNVAVEVDPVLPGDGTPAGTVTVSDGAGETCLVTLTGAIGTCTMPNATAGSKTITTTYGGSGDFNGSVSGGTSHVVDHASTTTGVGSNHNPSVHGQAVKFTASVAGNLGAGTPTGTVDFNDGATTIDSETLVSGMATFTTSALSTASHPMTVVYEGDSNYAGSTSPLVNQVVNQAATTTAVTSSVPTPPGPDPFGTSVTFTAHVVVTSPGVGIPTGSVNFKAGAVVIGSGTLDGTGHASFPTTTLPVGAHTITAVYADDADFVTSTSPGITQTVGMATPTVTVASGENPSIYGDSVTLSATVAGTITTPTGTLTFKDGGTPIGSAQALDGSGDAQITTSALHGGLHIITATYNGEDPNYTTATGTLAGGQQVNKATLNITANDASRAYGTANPTFTVVYGPFKNGENFATSDLTGAPTCSTTATPTSSVAGSPYNITCSAGSLLSNDYSFNFIDGQLTITAAASTTVVVSDHHPSVFGQSVTFTATITGFGSGAATGSVNFVIDAGAPQSRPVSGNQATFTTSSLSVATHTVTANYLGDGNMAPSSGTLAGGQIVNRSPSTTTITTDLTPVTFVGDAYTVAVAVTASGLGAGTPSGTVTISDGTDQCTTPALSGGVGSCLLTSSTAGEPKTITATYGGDVDFTGSSDNAPHTVDTPPVAAADVYSTNENGFVPSALTTTAGTGVLSNDTDADLDPLTAVKITDPSHGAVTLNANGSFTYTPNALYIGGDSFTYAANDGFTDSATATVTITVTAVNQPPSFALAGSPNVTVAEDCCNSVASSKANEAGGFVPGPLPAEAGQTLLGYVVTTNAPTMFASGAGQPAIDNSGTLTFKTFSNANGVATVTVKARDSGGTANGGVDLSAGQTFTITVTPVNDAPTANPDLVNVGQSSSSNTLSVLINDVAGPPDEQTGGANAQTIKITAVTQPAHGHVTIVNSNTQLDYVPTTGFVCPANTPVNCDTFTYTITDNGIPPLPSPAGTVFLTVTPSVIRYAGADRYATGVAIVSANYGTSQPVIYVATGTNFPDGLAGAAAAGFRHAPLVLINGQGSTIPGNINTELNHLIGPSTKIIVLGGTVSISTKMFNLLSAKAPLVAGLPNITRLADDNRYDTAVKVSADTYPTPPASGAVFLASGLAFPDALSASAVAGHLGAPLILVPGNLTNLSSVPKVTAELTRLAPTTIYIAGGTASVSSGIEAAVHTMFPLATIQRFAGANRYETATKIADFFFQNPAVPPFGATPVHTVYVASGLNFPDALAGGALAGSQGAPLLLVPGTSANIDGVIVGGQMVIKNEFGMTRLFPNRIIIFGSSGAVSTGIFNELVGFPKSS